MKRIKSNYNNIIYLVSSNGFDIESTAFKVTKPQLTIEDNYNDDFKSVHQIILKRLSKNNDKGFVLLFGRIGTGKTSYIRHLISLIKKKILFIPLNMISILTEPKAFPFLLSNRNSVFIIEDIDNINSDFFFENDDYFYYPISKLLNITDGLLSDCLHIQIICSFNNAYSTAVKKSFPESKKIAQYEFKELGLNKGIELSKKLGLKIDLVTPLTLEEIYSKLE